MDNKYVITPNGGFYSSSELYHYGVKGMRWGHRKAQKYSKLASTYRSGAKDWDDERKEEVGKLRAKGKDKRANKLDAEYQKQIKENNDIAKKYEDKAKQANKEASFQKAQADIGSKRSRGEKLVTNLVGGFYANRTYNSVKAAGGSNVAAWGVTAATGMIGGPLGHIAVAHLYTKAAGRDETRKRYK